MFALLRVVVCLWGVTTVALAQAPTGASTPTTQSLGVLQFTVAVPSGWKVGDVRKARVILERDGVVEGPTFALEGAAGGLIYGTFKTLPPGVIFTADTLAAMEDPALEKWGIKPADTRSFADQQAKGLRFAYLKARGLGNGLEFSPRLKVPTVGIWVDIPVAFREGGEVRAGLASLFYRGPATEAAASGEALLHDVIDALSPTSAVVPLAEFVSTRSSPSSPSTGSSTGAGPAAAAPGTPVPAVAGAWPDKLPAAVDQALGWPSDMASYAGGLTQVRRLEELFPANQWVQSLKQEWQTVRLERAQIGEWLKTDEQGLRRRDLTQTHEKVLASLTGAAAIRGYLAYLERVWPDNPFRTPPTDAGVAQWKHWPTGLVLQRSQVPGRAIWHTAGAACRTAAFVPEWPSDFRLATPEEYEVLLKQGTVPRQPRLAWLTGRGPTTTPADAAVMEFDRDRLVPLRKKDLARDCFAVLRTS